MDPDLKKQRLATALKWVGGIIGVALATPVIFIALKGTIGLLALGVAGGAGLAMLRTAPLLSDKLANFVMRKRIEEAAQNPIETLQNLRIEKTQELEDADAKIVRFETEVRNYNDQCKLFVKQYPDEAATYQEIADAMAAGLAERKNNQRNARAALKDLDGTIAKAEAHWQMAQAALKVTEMSKDVQARVFQDIKKKVALGSVQSKLNSAFASLTNSVDQAMPALPERRVAIDEPPVLEVSKIEVLKGGRRS